MKKTLFLLGLLFYINVPHATEYCPVDFFMIEKKSNVYELGIRNNMDRPYYMPYDRLPWVLLGGGVDFIIRVDGKLIEKASGTGHNSLILKIGVKSEVSSDVDLSFLKSFYSNIEGNRVSISWIYDVPSTENFDIKCKRFEGVIKAP